MQRGERGPQRSRRNKKSRLAGDFSGAVPGFHTGLKPNLGDRFEPLSVGNTCTQSLGGAEELGVLPVLNLAIIAIWDIERHFNYKK